MTEEHTLHISPIFKALSKPATFMGVDYDYFNVSWMVSVLAFIFSKSVLAALVFVPLYVIGVMLCRLDQQIFQVLRAKSLVGVVKNKWTLWKCQSYEAF